VLHHTTGLHDRPWAQGRYGRIGHATPWGQGRPGLMERESRKTRWEGHVDSKNHVGPPLLPRIPRLEPSKVPGSPKHRGSDLTAITAWRLLQPMYNHKIVPRKNGDGAARIAVPRRGSASTR
jgi:hypothetical protein